MMTTADDSALDPLVEEEQYEEALAKVRLRLGAGSKYTSPNQSVEEFRKHVSLRLSGSAKSATEISGSTDMLEQRRRKISEILESEKTYLSLLHTLRDVCCFHSFI